MNFTNTLTRDNLVPLVDKLNKIHKNIQFHNKTLLHEEIPEQIISIYAIKPEAKVLELGCSVGRNSCIINYLLKTKTDHVCIEPSKKDLHLLEKNKRLNNFEYHIENSAISKTKLYMDEKNPWFSTKIKTNDNQVTYNIVNFEDVEKKYNITFDTIVCDNEGNLPDMLREFPNMLDNIKTLFIEHDFLSLEDITFFYRTMEDKGFKNTLNYPKYLQFAPGMGWGMKEDPVFVSLWERK